MKARLRRALIITATVAVLLIGSGAVAWADAPPPTNGGNGAGQSGQCTGNPDDRPAGLPCS